MTAIGVAPVTISCAGRLGRDPEARQTAGGKDMTLGALAVDLSAGPDAPPETWWLNLMAFGKTAGDLAKHHKGDRLSVMGQLQRGRYQPRNGAPDRESWTVLVDAVLGPRSPRPAGKRKPAAAGPAPGPAAPGGPIPGDLARQDPPPPFDDGLGF